MIEVVKLFLIAVILGFCQAFIIQEVDMGVWLRPMPYLFLFFISPINTNRYAILALAFILGTFIDLMSDTFGTHSAATVAMVFAKHYIDKRWIDFDSLKLQGETYIGIETRGWPFYAYYTLSLVFIHHFTFFLLDYFELVSFFRMLITTLVSSAGTFLLILLLKSIFRR